MKMTARIRPVAEQKTASEALVLPVRGAGGAARADHAGVGERRGHAVVLEAAGRIHALVLQEQPARVHADVGRDRVGLLQDRLPLADGQDLLRRRERQQFAEAPDAAEAERIGAVGPLRLEVAQRLRRLQPVPVVGDVEQAAALGTCNEVSSTPAVAAQSGLIQR